jgi:hypothetical protein
MGRRGADPYGVPKKGTCDWHRGAPYVQFTKDVLERPGVIMSLTMCHSCKRLVRTNEKSHCPVTNTKSR